MAVQWNKVTWYSKMIALILFVALPFAGFYYGMQYGQTLATLQQNPSTVNPAPSTTPDYYTNVSEWQTDIHDDAGFSIAYPIDFPVDDNHAPTPSTDWRLNSPNINGVKVFTLTVPGSFEPQTNLADANLTVGYSSNNIALTQCLQPDTNVGPTEATSSAMINGIQFIVFHSNDAGAGNYYETTSYRTLHAGSCYAVEYTIHSSQIANYPASYNLKPFDEAPITTLLQTIVGTFKFL